MVSKFYLLCTFLLLSSSSQLTSAKKELKLLHVLSANKFYVPGYNQSSTTFEAPTNLTYKFFVENAVDVPNSVKLHLFNLGTHLRSTYGSFIESIYMDEIIKMQTMESPISIIAGELINAGLWPPIAPQIWKDDLAWQPIPFVYTPAKEDALLLGTLCTNFEYETQKVLKNHYNLSAEHAKLLNYINKEGQMSLSNPIEVSLLYLALENSIELNQMHPEWVKKIYPGDALRNLTLQAYDLLSKTALQKQLNGGSFLKTIIKDSKDHIKGTLSNERKINVYSGDERNLAGVLNNLNHPLYELPNAGAALIFELYAEDLKHFIKINYYMGKANYEEGFVTLPLTLNECDTFCPIEKFSELVADVLPGNELSLCGSMISDQAGNSGAFSKIHPSADVLYNFLSVIMLYTTSRFL